MSKRGFDVLLVRKSGPVRSLSMNSGWLYLLVLVLVLMVAGVGGSSYLLYRQQLQLTELSDDTRLLMLRAERLESLVQEQETRDILSQQSSDERASSASPGKGKKGAATPPPPPAESDEAAGETLPPGEEPQSSDRLSIKNIEQRVEGGELVVAFDLINEREPRDPAIGYMALVVKGQRQGKPWAEAWPPMRLTSANRPQNYHRGTPFSVQRYRRVLARVASVEDKKLESLEFVIYSRQGNLVLVKALPLTPSKGSSR